ncbi:MAG: hypothetical protein HY904_07235 [Deltaproteobacteria bacterium]|nr:hypothetical protein [Deltaproteobacteria bacterium]
MKVKALLITALILAGAYGLIFRDSDPFLMGFEGRVVRVWKESIPMVSTGSPESLNMLEVETATGRITVEVPLSVWGEARSAKHVVKKRFSNKYVFQ